MVSAVVVSVPAAVSSSRRRRSRHRVDDVADRRPGILGPSVRSHFASLRCALRRARSVSSARARSRSASIMLSLNACIAFGQLADLVLAVQRTTPSTDSIAAGELRHRRPGSPTVGRSPVATPPPSSRPPTPRIPPAGRAERSRSRTAIERCAATRLLGDVQRDLGDTEQRRELRHSQAVHCPTVISRASRRQSASSSCSSAAREVRREKFPLGLLASRRRTGPAAAGRRRPVLDRHPCDLDLADAGGELEQRVRPESVVPPAQRTPSPRRPRRRCATPRRAA